MPFLRALTSKKGVRPAKRGRSPTPGSSIVSFTQQRTVIAGEVRISVINPTTETLFKSVPQLHRNDSDTVQMLATPCTKIIGDMQFIAAPALVPDRPVQIMDKAHEKTITTVAVSNSGLIIATGSEDGVLRLWDFYTGTIIREMSKFTSAIYSVHFGYNDTVIIAGENTGAISTWNTTNGKLKKIYRGHTNRVNVVRFLSDKSHSNIISGGSDSTLRLWRYKYRILHFKTMNAESPVMDLVTFLENTSLRALTAQFSGHIHVWDLSKHTRIASIDHFHGQVVTSLSLFIEGQVVITLSRDNILRFLDIKRGLVITELTHVGFRANSNYTKAAISHDRSIITAGGADGSIYTWNLANNSILGVVKAHNGPVNCVVWNFGGNLISGGNDRKIVIWDGRELLTTHLSVS